jgi:hypothetical protein
MDIEMFIPQIIRKRHSKFVSNFLETGNPKLIGGPFATVFIESSDGYIIEAEMLLRLDTINMNSLK